MKLALVATTVIVTTATLTSLSLPELAHAQDFLNKENISDILTAQTNNNLLDRNKQIYNRDRYDNRYDNRYDRGRGSNYYNEINRLYREILGRNADNQGLRTWSRQLERGRSLNDVRREIAYSREAETEINNIYRQYFGRNVDRNGLRTWQAELARGRSLRDVQRAIQRSPEARGRRY
jgi:hypothetical protein